MKRTALIVALACIAAQAHADTDTDFTRARAIAGEHACLGCHAVDKKLVGPAYRDVAARYSGQSNAVALLVKHVQQGSAGVWGNVPMPPNRIDAVDARLVVNWVLAGAPDH
ncbi:cytochrome C [Paraburkholderia sediminicola]|uniref:c-type cytochrome n=1 Tax=Paraburkholderia sediminicola TaxID=458836 RepID=UPI00131AEA3C